MASHGNTKKRTGVLESIMSKQSDFMQQEVQKQVDRILGLALEDEKSIVNLTFNPVNLPKLTREEYLEAFAIECGEYVNLTSRKNNDYAGSENAFKNFTLVEFLTNGSITTEMGIIVRLCDKLQRVTNLLLGTKSMVKNESIHDTVRDMAVYATILNIIYKARARAAAGRDKGLAARKKDDLSSRKSATKRNKQ